MPIDPVFSIQPIARAADHKAQGFKRSIGAFDDVDEFHDCADWTDDIGVDSKPWHKTACRETALFIEDTY